MKTDTVVTVAGVGLVAFVGLVIYRRIFPQGVSPVGAGAVGAPYVAPYAGPLPQSYQRPPSVIAAIAAKLSSWGWDTNNGGNGFPQGGSSTTSGPDFSGQTFAGGSVADNLRATGGYYGDI